MNFSSAVRSINNKMFHLKFTIMDKYKEMNEMAIGTTFHAWLNGNLTYFAKVDTYTWCIRICIQHKGIANSMQQFTSISTEIEASDIWEQCNED